MNHGEVLCDLLHVLVVEEGVETRLVYKETAEEHNVPADVTKPSIKNKVAPDCDEA